ncbi:hypothetical protein GGF44_006079 [Coemansia sp. RSA 1694]|nr:hypothetical protein GGF44_006079 [Coemansia sp. RSA 1694]
MYRFAKIGVLVWAQHRKYNGAAWLYDTFVRPLLPPPPPQQPPSGALRRHSTKDATATGDDYNNTSISKDSRHHSQASIDSASGSVQEISGQQNRAIQPSSFSFSAMAVASVWDATANVGTGTIPPALTSDSRA